MARRNRNSPGLAPQVPKSSYGLLKAVLDFVSDHSEDLAAGLDGPHQAGGNPGYPAWQMLRLLALKYLLGERFANRFLQRVDNDYRMLELCGISRTPSEVAFSRFKNHKMVPHQHHLDHIIVAVVFQCAAEIEELRKLGVVPDDAPKLGEILAIDATDIPAYARYRGEHCDPPGAENCKKKHRTHCDNPGLEECTRHTCPDSEARWGYRTPKNKSPRSGKGQSPEGKESGKEFFFGYDADVIVDAYHGLPLYLNVRAANLNEGTRMMDDVKALRSLHPWMKPRCLTADKGYHAGYNFRYLVKQKIIPIIAIPRPQKDPQTSKRLYEGIYNEKGIPLCIGGQVMDYLGTEEDGSHRFRCPEGGCHLKDKMDWSRYCDFDFAEKPKGKLLRIMGIIHRASPEWKRLFKLRPTVERWFSSAKRSRLLDQHQYLGQDRVSLHAKMSLLGYLLTSWGRLKAGDYEGMRQMHIRLPRRPALAAELREKQECGDCCLCSLHDSLAA